MAITTDDFNKIWASTSPLTPYSFSKSQYKEGWNFIGSTPPSRQMWDFLQKNNDEKMQYLLNNFDNYLPLSGGTVTGVVNGVTPTAGDNSTKIATTAWVQKLLADALAKQKTAYEQAISTAVSAAKTQAKLDAHPVGSYYWSNDSTSPADLFGGTWEALPAGYTLIAQGSGRDDFGSYTYTAGQKYGERKHQLTTDEMPKIEGSVSSLLRWNTGKVQSGVLKAVEGTTKFPSSSSENVSNTTVSIEFGKDVAHENLPPMVAAFAWKRTA